MECRSGLRLDTNEEMKVYKPTAPLLFSCTKQFGANFTPASDPSIVVVDLQASALVDISAILAIVAAAKRYREKNKSLFLTNASSQDMAAVTQASDLGKGIEYIDAEQLRIGDIIGADQEKNSTLKGTL